MTAILGKMILGRGVLGSGPDATVTPPTGEATGAGRVRRKYHGKGSVKKK